MKHKKDFYRNAKAYDIAFGDRDFSDECDFLEWCLKEHSNLEIDKLQDKAFLELASGPSHHAIEMAKRNWRSIAIDNSDDMLAYATELAKEANVNIEAINADMIEYKLDKPVAMVATMMESIAHVLTNDQMVSHMRSVADSLLPGGIYIIEATHPDGFFPDDEANIWTEKRDGMKVQITFGEPDDEYDYITQQWDVTTRLRIWNGTGEEYVDENKVRLRWYLAQEIKALIDLSGAFEDYWFYGNVYSIPPQPFDNSDDSDSMVIVLRKKKD